MPTNDTYGLLTFLSPAPALSLLKSIGKTALTGLGLSAYTYANLTSNTSVPLLDPALDTGRVLGAGASAGARFMDAGPHVVGGSGVGFWTSKWALSNILMPLVLYRIQHLHIPRARLRRLARAQARRYPPPLSIWAFLFPLSLPGLGLGLVPIDTRSMRTRLVLRLPSLVFLARAWAVLAVLLLQTSGLWPEDAAGRWGVQGLGDWVRGMQMAEVCWSVYKSVCFAMLTGTFLSNLEGSHANAEVSFNLFPFALLLYTHSTVMQSSSDRVGSALPARPNPHVIITILIPFTLMVLLHLQGISRKWASKKLVPSTVCGLLGQAHFIYVLFHSIQAYPAFGFVGGIFELLFLLSILSTAALRALSQFLLEGRITSQVFGHASSFPAWEDDYGVAVLKLAQAGMADLSRAAGLSNELVELNERAREPVVELGRAGVELTPPAPASYGSSPLSSSASRSRGGKGNGPAPALGFGFNREFRTIRVRPDAAAGPSIYNVSELWKAARRLGGTVVWVVRAVGRKLVPAPASAAAAAAGSGGAVGPGGGEEERELLLGMGGALTGEAGYPAVVAGGGGAGEEDGGARMDGWDAPERVYARFLAGEADDEDEGDPDWEGEGEGESDVEDDTDGDADADAGTGTGAEDMDERDDSALYTDLMRGGAGSGPGGTGPEGDADAEGEEEDGGMASSLALAPVLLAHLMSREPRTLTRRRYREVVRHSMAGSASWGEDAAGPDGEWQAFVHQRRQGQGQGQIDWSRTAETALNCAVCMSEPRAVVCWPCRCLAMCDECRASIAARFTLVGQHVCPCCRQRVEGYSRIYIP